MDMKQVIQLDADGYFVGPVIADASPLEPGVYLIPAGAVDAPMPTIPEGKRAKWNGQWVFEDIPQPEPEPEPEPEPLTPEQEAELARAQRRLAYQAEADPLFFKWQAGEGTKEDWEAKREEIRVRYPYAGDDA
jgi:hypothetical protein